MSANVDNANTAFHKAKMYGLIESYLGSMPNQPILQQKQYDDRLRKVILLFQSPELMCRLGVSERRVYEKYIKSMVDEESRRINDKVKKSKDKKERFYFHFVTGIFFASLTAMLIWEFGLDPYWDNLTKKLAACDRLSDGWMECLDNCEDLFIGLYLQNEYQEYLKEKSRKLTKAMKNPDKLKSANQQIKIREQYNETEVSYKEKKWHELNREMNQELDQEQGNILSEESSHKLVRAMSVAFHNLNSICFQMVMINYEKKDNLVYQEKLEIALNKIKCLPIDTKDKVFSDDVKKKIDSIYDIANRHLENLYAEFSKATISDVASANSIAELYGYKKRAETLSDADIAIDTYLTKFQERISDKSNKKNVISGNGTS